MTLLGDVSVSVITVAIGARILSTLAPRSFPDEPTRRRHQNVTTLPIPRRAVRERSMHRAADRVREEES